MKRWLEIRTYTTLPGMRDQLHRLMRDHSLPMLQRWGVDVVRFGPSPHDELSYMLMRVYPSLAEREASQDAFYGSEEWLQGPRREILDTIDEYISVVVELDDAAIDALRMPLPAAPPKP